MSITNNILSAEDWIDKKRMVSVTKKVLESGTTLHMHEFYEMEMITSGSGVQNLNGNIYDLKKGTIYFLSPVDFHSVTPQKQLGIVNISFNNNTISPQLLNALIGNNGGLIFQLRENEIRQVEFLIELLVGDCNAFDQYSKVYTKNLIECLLILIVRGGNLSYRPKSGEDVSPMYKCMRHLFLHFNETPSLEDMARISGYSANYFSKQFHEITGKKYIDFLTSLKLKHAKLLLTSTKESVIDVSLECGFTSLSNFNRVFKKETGVSPTRYRSQDL